MTSSRPVFLDLWRIRLLPTGIVSILHRVSGFLMLVATPLGVWLLGLSLSGPAGFDSAIAVLSHPLAKLVLLIVAWSLLHHLFAGARHLLLDLGVGLERTTARRSAWAAIGLSVAVLALGAGFWL